MNRRRNNLPDDLECLRCHYNHRGLNRSRRCPECGYAIRKTLSGSEPWSIAIGLRRAVLNELRWGAMFLAALTAVLWLASPALRHSPRLSMLLEIAVTVPVTWLLWHRLVEAAGFLSAILVGIALTTIAIVALGSAAVASVIGPLDPAAAFGFGAFLCLFSFLWIIYDFRMG